MEDFKIREGTVLSNEPGRLVVRMDPQADTGECGGCGSCALKKLCRGRDSGHMDLPVDSDARTAGVRPGDRVAVAYRGVNQAVAALVLFAPSLVGLLGGAFAGYALWDGSDTSFLVGAGLGLGLGLAVTFAATRLSRALRPTARLVISG